jgi:hypothetical protein
MNIYSSDPFAYARPIPLVQAPIAPVAAAYGAQAPLGRADGDDMRFDCAVTADGRGGFVASCTPRSGGAPARSLASGRAVCVVDPDRNGFEMDCDFD